MLDVNHESTNGKGRPRAGREREGQRTKRRRPAEKATEERGSERTTGRAHNENAPRQAARRTGGERHRGGKRTGSGGGKDREVRESGRDEGATRNPTRKQRSRDRCVRSERESPSRYMSGGRKAGSYRFQTIPCLHCEASRRTFANVNCRHRTSSCTVTAHTGAAALMKRMVLRSSYFHMCRGPECDTIRLKNWNMQILLEGNL